MGLRSVCLVGLLCCVAADKYGDLCDKMIQKAQDAAKHHNQGNQKKAEKAMQRVDALYEEAAALEPEELQAHLNYGTTLINTNQLDKAASIWQLAASVLTDDIRTQVPHMESFIAGKINLCAYGKVSMQKDQVYKGGKGDLTMAIDLVDEQLALRPLPQIYHDRATMNIMISNSEEKSVAGIEADFKQAETEALKGHIAAKRVHLKIPCKESTELTRFPYDDGAEAAPIEEFVSHYTSYSVNHAAVSRKKTNTDYTSTAPYMSTVEDVYVRGMDAVVTTDRCPGKWSRSKVERRLAKTYEKLELKEQKNNVKKILDQFYTAPEILRDALKDKYTKLIEEKEVDLAWIDEWAVGAKAECDCVVYEPSQSPRVNLGMNLPIVDVFGAHPVLDQSGKPDVLTPPKQLSGKLKEAALAAQFAGSSFYHFVIEVLPRVLMVLQDSSLEKVPIIVPMDTSKNHFVERYLRIIAKKYNIKDFVSKFKMHQGEVHVEKLHVPTWYRDDMVTRTTAPRSALLNLRQALVENVKNIPQNKVIYLSRKDTSMRQLVDDEELFGAISARAERKGYEVVKVSSALDAAEAIKVFRGAKMVVGVHGGAMANLIACKEDTIVLELGFDSEYSHDYVHLSAHLGLDHHLFPLLQTPNGMGAAEVEVSSKEPFLDAIDNLLPFNKNSEEDEEL